ncbi:hypothetical protein ACFW1A_23195 [Kitasatospora sp. NPDC058965]|uniref:hypothetical protein n=1 Tax=Kitasatospora sp. NPDC058965 TaxID=3346682 RepID=UPI0036C5DBEF
MTFDPYQPTVVTDRAERAWQHRQETRRARAVRPGPLLRRLRALLLRRPDRPAARPSTAVAADGG